MKKLIKKLLIVTVVVAMVVTAMPLSGIEFEEITKLFTIESEAAAIVMSDVKFEGLYYYRDISGEEDFIEDGNTIESGSEIVKYMGSEENVVIPSELGGKPVVSINHEAFCPDTLTASEINSNKYNSDYPVKKSRLCISEKRNEHIRFSVHSHIKTGKICQNNEKLHHGFLFYRQTEITVGSDFIIIVSHSD